MKIVTGGAGRPQSDRKVDMEIMTLPGRCVVGLCVDGECGESGSDFELRRECTEALRLDGLREYVREHVCARDVIQCNLSSACVMGQEMIPQIDEIAAFC